MAFQRAEFVLSPDRDEKGRYRIKKEDFDIYVYPATEGTTAKIRVAMKVDQPKVPPRGAGPAAVVLSEFTGEEEAGGDFIFSISKVEARLIRPRTSGATTQFLIEFEVPGASVPSNGKPKMRQSSSRSEKK